MYKVILFGLGPIGCKVADQLSEKDAFEIVGAVDIDPQKVNMELSKLAGLAKPSVLVQSNATRLFEMANADIAVLTTGSDLDSVYPQVREAILRGVNVISSCEELVFPWLTYPELSHKIDRLAKENKVSVLATGVNPGFMMDTLPLTLSGVCREVTRLRIDRIQDASIRRLPFQKKIGAGLSVAEFRKKVEQKSIRHVGLTESIQMIASHLGWRLSSTEDIVEPVIAKKKVVTPHLTIAAGQVLGVHQTGRGYVTGDEVITLIFKAAIGENDPREQIKIEGDPEINMMIPGGVNGDTATTSIIINAIPAVIRAQPGLKTMIDIGTVTCLK